MKMLTQEEAKRICDKVMSLSAPTNAACRSATAGQYPLRAQCGIDGRPARKHRADRERGFRQAQGTASINEFDDKSLEKVVRRAEDVARLAPENPEFLPAIKQQATNLLPPSARRLPPSIRSTARKWRPSASTQRRSRADRCWLLQRHHRL
jgi:hypothetical protein